MKCPKCDREMKPVEKNTSSGREIRTYSCVRCKEHVDVDEGIALWKAFAAASKMK
jgi:hypothetical protein